MKRVICWDLWGTLVTSSWSSRQYIDVLVENEARFLEPRNRLALEATVRGVFMTSAAKRQKAFDLAVSGREHLTYGFCASMMVGDDPFVAPEVAKLWEQENEAVEWLPDAAEVLCVLKACGGKQVLVSNTTEAGWLTVNGVLGLTNHDRFGTNVVLSCDLPVAKPDPYVWQTVQERFPADEYWMIGNDPVMDIAVPAAMGWKTILVNHPDGVPITEVPKIIQETK